MSNFADMAYDNYLMHYRTKGSKNGYTKDPDYTPVGERARGDYAGMPSSALAAKERNERTSEINRLSNQFSRKGDTGGMPSSDREAMRKATLEASRRKRDEQEKRDEEIHKITKNPWLRAYREDYSGMPTSAKDALLDAYRKTLEKRAARKEAAKEYARSVEISKLSKQKSKGDYSGMPSSALAAKERASEISKLSKRASSGDYSGMPTSAKEAQARAKEERNKKILAKYEINQLSKQASRGDLGGMPSSARAAKEKADRASEISRLNAQRVRADYAGMPSSALRAKENAQAARIEEAKARYQKLNAPIEMKRQAEAKRKAEYMKRQAEANRLNTTYEKSKRYREEYKKRTSPNYDAIEEMKGKAEAKRLNSPYEKYKREKAANENRERELLLAENKRRQRVTQKEKKRAEEIERYNAAKSERDRTVKDWESIVNLNKSNSALKSSNGYESRLMKEKKRVSKLTGKSPKDWRREKRDELLKKYGITPFSNGKWRKV